MNEVTTTKGMVPTKQIKDKFRLYYFKHSKNKQAARFFFINHGLLKGELAYQFIHQLNKCPEDMKHIDFHELLFDLVEDGTIPQRFLPEVKQQRFIWEQKKFQNKGMKVKDMTGIVEYLVMKRSLPGLLQQMGGIKRWRRNRIDLEKLGLFLDSLIENENGIPFDQYINNWVGRLMGN